MDWNQLLLDIAPLLADVLTAVVSALLIFLASKANTWIKANTDGSQLALINMAAKQIVLFLEQVGEARGWASNEAKKEYAVNRLIQDLGKLGISLTMEQADVAIEAAVMEFTSNSLEYVEGVVLEGIEPGTISP